MPYLSSITNTVFPCELVESRYRSLISHKEAVVLYFHDPKLGSTAEPGKSPLRCSPHEGEASTIFISARRAVWWMYANAESVEYRKNSNNWT